MYLPPHRPPTPQAQLHENEGLRRELASETQRAAVLEAKMGALSSPAEVSGMLAHSQVRCDPNGSPL